MRDLQCLELPHRSVERELGSRQPAYRRHAFGDNILCLGAGVGAAYYYCRAMSRLDYIHISYTALATLATLASFISTNV